MLDLNETDFRQRLDDLWVASLNHIENARFARGDEIPLLIVVRAGDIREKINRAGGVTELDPSHFTNREQALDTPFYLVLDVEDGRGEVAKSPEESLKRFAKTGRKPLNLDESIALITQHPEILKHHYLISVGTFVKKEKEELPLLWLLDDNDQPELHYAWFDIAHGHYGSASCLARI